MLLTTYFTASFLCATAATDCSTS